jgi:hypothetical protein
MYIANKHSISSSAPKLSDMHLDFPDYPIHNPNLCVSPFFCACDVWYKTLHTCFNSMQQDPKRFCQVLTTTHLAYGMQPPFVLYSCYNIDAGNRCLQAVMQPEHASTQFNTCGSHLYHSRESPFINHLNILQSDRHNTLPHLPRSTPVTALLGSTWHTERGVLHSQALFSTTY